MQEDLNVKISMDNTNIYLVDWAMEQDAVIEKGTKKALCCSVFLVVLGVQIQVPVYTL